MYIGWLENVINVPVCNNLIVCGNRLNKSFVLLSVLVTQVKDSLYFWPYTCFFLTCNLYGEVVSAEDGPMLV